LERWRTISLAVHRIGTELQQVTPAYDALAFEPVAVAKANVQADRDSAVAGAVSYLAPVGRLGRPARSGFVQIDRRLEWWLWDDLTATTTPEKITLLDNVDAVRWRFLSGERWIGAWPAESGAPSPLPAAVTLELELPDAGTLVRVFALR
jgi:general secretion pathway protein J